jgi:hypothetical protein
MGKDVSMTIQAQGSRLGVGILVHAMYLGKNISALFFISLSFCFYSIFIYKNIFFKKFS